MHLNLSLTHLKTWILGKIYELKYDSLDPLDYSKEKFSKHARDAHELLNKAKKELPELPINSLQDCWRDNLEKLDKIFAKPLAENFLSIPIIAGAMVRRGWNKDQRLELTRLKKSKKFYSNINANFTESRVGSPHLECKDLRCSSGTLGYLYYLLRLEELKRNTGRKDALRVTELGGGYGGFCRAYFKLLNPKTYTIIDLPEFCSLQYLYLKTSLPEVDVQMVISRDERPIEHGIRLIPVNIIVEKKMNPATELFTSHFALTESGKSVRQIIYDTEFFQAKEVYYVGQQAARWSESVDPEVISALPERSGWRIFQTSYYQKDCIEIYACR